jgi:hypothetical protein
MTIPFAVIPAALQTALGIGQAIGGAVSLSKQQRPTYEIPKEIQQNVAQAQALATEGLGAQQEQYMRQQVERGTSAALQTGTERGAGFAGLGGVLQAQNDAFMNIAMQDEMLRKQRLSEVADAKGVLASYKDMAFELNKLMPYQEKVAAAQANIGAGMQNIGGALKTLAIMSPDKSINIGGNGNRSQQPTQTPSQTMPVPTGGASAFDPYGFFMSQAQNFLMQPRKI